ncbi:MAG: hemolysin family protein [Actinomycetota bacterium]|nr:hemolysin family protein [Actinomycetota bacterium]
MIATAFAFSAVLVFLTAILRAAGATLVRTPRADALHDAGEGNVRAQVVADLLDERQRIQPALGTVVTTLLILAVIPASWAMERLHSEWELSGWALALAFIAMTLLIVLLSDLIPRTIGRSRSRAFAYRFSRILRIAIRIGDAANDLVSDDEEDEDDEEDDDDRGERELISSIIEFGDTIVREVMVPRTDMVTLPAAASSDDAVDLVLDAGRSRIPLTGENVDDIVGLLYARDLLTLYDEEAPARPARDLAHEAYFVPETKAISELLREMQAKQKHLAIVVDEFGGTAGVVTIEDLIEEIVGEIVDEYDDEEPMMVPLESGGYLVDARLDVDDLADVLDVEFPDEEWDTVGGLVLDLAGRVPEIGESFEYEGVILTAEEVQGRRVARVRAAKR